jgi:hypothetical protein
MTAKQDETQKVFVSQNGAVIIKCPVCEAVKEYNVDKFRGVKHSLSVKCRCQHLFSVNLEFRKFYRKTTRLSGDYMLLPEKINRGRMMVVNLSRGGAGLQITGAHRLQPGQEIQLSFTLDDRHQSLVGKRAVVRLIMRDYIGCEFVGDFTQDKALGFYLMV